jgi:hypothetical protein
MKALILAISLLIPAISFADTMIPFLVKVPIEKTKVITYNFTCIEQSKDNFVCQLNIEV